MLTNEQILEGNRCIAESPFSNCTKSFETYFNSASQFHFEIEQAEYHCSWDWLMPVVEKISKTKWLDSDNGTDNGFYYFVTFGMRNDVTGQSMVRISGFGLHEADELIEAVWIAVTEFIQWHSKLTQP